MSFLATELSIESEIQIVKKWLIRLGCLGGESMVKISDAKEKFPTIHIVVLEQVFDCLVNQGLITLEGKSRIKVFKIIHEEQVECQEFIVQEKENIPNQRIANKHPLMDKEKNTQLKQGLNRMKVINQSVVSIDTPCIPINNNIMPPQPQSNLQQPLELFDNFHENNINSNIDASATATTNPCSVEIDKSHVILFDIISKCFEQNGDGTASVTDICKRAVTAGCHGESEAKEVLEFMANNNKIMIDGDVIYEI